MQMAGDGKEPIDLTQDSDDEKTVRLWVCSCGFQNGEAVPCEDCGECQWWCPWCEMWVPTDLESHGQSASFVCVFWGEHKDPTNWPAMSEAEIEEDVPAAEYSDDV